MNVENITAMLMGQNYLKGKTSSFLREMMDWLKGRKVSKRVAVIIIIIVWQITTLIMQNL